MGQTFKLSCFLQLFAVDMVWVLKTVVLEMAQGYYFGQGICCIQECVPIPYNDCIHIFKSWFLCYMMKTAHNMLIVST